MPTVQEHLNAIYEKLGWLDEQIVNITRVIQAMAVDPLQQEIDLDLPHASAGSAPEGGAGGEATVETEVTDDSLTVRLPSTTPERKAARRQFAAEILRLNETFPDLDASGGLSAVDAYAAGGPMWLYLGSKEGRDHILTLPTTWKQAMVEDIAETLNPQDAHEFARDVLKDAEATANMGVTYDYLLSTVE